MHPPAEGQALGSLAVVWATGFALLRPVAFLVFTYPKNDLGRVVSRILSSLVIQRRGSFILCDLTRSLGHFRPRDGPSLGPLFGLAPNGVFRAASLALGAVGSYPTFSPLPWPEPWRFVFCGTFRQQSLSKLPPACIPKWSLGYTASRPVVFGLSSPNESTPKAILHPSKINENTRLKKDGNQGTGTTLVINCHLKHHVRGEIEDHPAMRTKIDAFPMLTINDNLRWQFHVAIATHRMLDP